MVLARLGLLIGSIALHAAALPAAAAADDTRFAWPRPAALEPAVAFWTRVYTEVDTHSGFIHDDRELDVVYGRLRLDPYASSAEHQKAIARSLANHRKALLSLAGGKRHGLTETEQRALQAWGPAASSATLQAAAERVRFQRGQADRFQGGLTRADKWERRIREIFRRHGLPEELVVLPHVESSYNPRVRSPAGAAGLWQFMPATARRYLRVDDKVDERLDVYKSSAAAAGLLQHYHGVLGSWPLALTAYNHGLAGVRRAVRQTGSEDIGEIVRAYDGERFGFASRNFYAAFLAAVDVCRDPEAYFGSQREKFGPRPITLITEAYVPIDAVVDAFGVDKGELRRLNPKLPRTIWSGALLIPKGQALRLPPQHTLPEAAAKMAALCRSEGYLAQRPDVYHEVREGETLSVIAARYQTDADELVTLNRLRDRHAIRDGQLLLIASGPEPQPVVTAAIVESVQADTDSDRGRGASDEDWLDTGILPIETQPDLAADPADYSVRADGRIRIQAAETLGHYAEWSGSSVKRLRELNRLGDRRPLVVGRQLRLELAKTARADFERQRLAHHRNLQASYFERHRIVGLRQHRVGGGDSLWRLATATYGIPLWLLRQYNPDVALDTVLSLGGVIAIPVAEQIRAEQADWHAPEQQPETEADTG